MRSIIFTATFFLAFLTGIGSEYISGGNHRHGCQGGRIVYKKPLFRLSETSGLKERKVVSKSEGAGSAQTGRIIRFEMSAPDQYFIVVAWEKSRADENVRPTIYDRERFYSELELAD